MTEDLKRDLLTLFVVGVLGFLLWWFVFRPLFVTYVTDNGLVRLVVVGCYGFLIGRYSLEIRDWYYARKEAR